MPCQNDERLGVLQQIPDDTVLWRYTDIYKLIDLLTSSTLAFVRTPLLGDEWEGAVAPRLSAQEALAHDAWLSLPRNRELLIEREGRREQATSFLNSFFVSCWHEGREESMAMWNVYGGHVAIRSTAGRLNASFIDDPYYYLARVDYGSSAADMQSVHRVFCKRSAFRDEREVRLAIQTRHAPVLDRVYQRPPLDVLPIRITADNLIDTIVVSPTLPPYARQAAAFVLRQLFKGPVVISPLADAPAHFIDIPNSQP